MKKIAILSFWGVPNAGAFGQAYALQKTISKLFPNYQVFQIKHLSKEHRHFHLMDEDNAPEWQKKMNEIYARAFDVIPHIGLNQERMDLIVLGSDIIWDFNIKEFGEDIYLFGNDLDCEKVISYAPSVGTCKGEWRRIPDYVSVGLNGLAAISVRDKNSEMLIEYIVGKKPQIVLDPVWLWDWCNDEMINVPNLDNFILVYGESFSNAFIENLINYAKEKEMKLVTYSVDDAVCSWCDIVLNPLVVSPLEVFGYFKAASLVATSTFHGITFGLVFSKKIAYSRSNFIDAKIKNMLIEIGIDDFFYNDDVAEMFNRDWNYENIKQKIDEMKKESINYLVESIKDNCY